MNDDIPLDSKRYGIIEVGSKGIRLLVADVSDGSIVQVVHSTGDLSQLGQEVDENGNLSSKSMRHVVEMTKEYLNIAKKHETEQIRVIATEGVRAAPNKKMLLEEFAGSDIDLHILDPQEEALYSFLASFTAFRGAVPPGATLMVIDQGGGNTELTAGTADENGQPVLKHMHLFDFGTTKLSALMLGQPELGDGFDVVHKLIDETLASRPRFQLFADAPPTLTIGLGSSLTSLIKRLNADLKLTRLHGMSIQTSEMDTLIQDTPRNTPTSALKDKDLIELISGVLNYQKILSFYGIQMLHLSRNGMSYGALLALAGKKCKVELS